MSYKFTLDHTLEFEDIHDMITIDIKPETRCSVTGSDVEVKGLLAFNGTYLTDELGEERFEGKIPLDITLPYLGGAPDVRPEIASFDYLVNDGESLMLNLEISLNGYEIQMNSTDRRDDAIDAWVDPVTDGIVIEEARIEPFDITVPAEESPVALAPVTPAEESAVASTSVVRAEESPVASTSVVRAEESPVVLAPVTPAEESHVVLAPVTPAEESPVASTSVRAEESPVVLAPVTPAEESPDALDPVLSVVEDVVAIDRDECVAQESVEDTASPVVIEEQSVEEEEPIPYSPLVDMTRDIDTEKIELESPLDQNLPVEIVDEEIEEEIDEEIEEEGRTAKLTNSASALVDELFDIDREMVVKEDKEVEVPVVLETVELPEQIDEEIDADEEAKPVRIVDSVARQFADCASTIKMVYVRDEAETLGTLLTRYAATMDDVWNLPELADGVNIGDCVMIKYEKRI